MSICDKIQHIGNTLETNLNNLDVDCTFGIGTGEQKSQVTFRAKNIRIKSL